MWSPLVEFSTAQEFLLAWQCVKQGQEKEPVHPPVPRNAEE
jgi:hypothetical protein